MHLRRLHRSLTKNNICKCFLFLVQRYCKRSPLGPSQSATRSFWMGIIPGTVPEIVRTCGLKRSLSNLDRAPCAGLCLVEFLGQFFSDPAFSFLRNLRVNSSAIPRTDVFSDWVSLECSCVSLETAANFHLFLNFATC